MVRDARRAAAALLCLAMLVSTVVLLPSSTAATPTKVLFTEDFEGASAYRGEWPGTLPNGWDISDRSVSSTESWSRTTYTYVSASHSAGVALAPTLRYGPGMDAYMRHPLGDLSGYQSVSLTFQYWSQTGNSTTAPGSDYLWVSVSTSASSSPPDQAADREIWRQPVANCSSWRVVTVDLPLNATWVSFDFHSDAASPGGYMGAFVDDVAVQAADGLAPVSHVGSMPATLNDHVFAVPVDITSGGGGLSTVKLYYRANGTGDFALYTTPGNTRGEWAKGDVITFATTTDGKYEFFTIATDKLGNAEPMKSAAEATVLVDTVRPYSAASVTGNWGNDGWYNAPATVNLTAGDALSGVAAILYRLDGGDWSTYKDSFSVGSDGDHLLEYYARDRAGNEERAHSAYLKVDRTGPVVEFQKQSGLFSSGDLDVRLKITDPASGPLMAQASLDGGTFQPLDIENPQATYSGLSEGDHTLVVRSWDFAGNVNETSWTFNVDQSILGGDIASAIVPVGAVGITLLSLAAILLVSRRRR